MKRFEQIPGRSVLADAARFVLGNRLAKLHEFATAITQGNGDDIEAVHQLRVYCRRVTAASDVLVDAVPPKPLRKLRKRLKRVRRAAGKIRDCDVLAMELQNVRPKLCQEERIAAEHLLEAYPHRRERGRKRLYAKVAKLERKRFWNWVVKRYPPLESVGDIAFARENERSLADLAREKLPVELDDFLAALSLGRPGDYEQLHRVRIAAKRLRYVLEVFAGCFPPEYRQQIYNPIKRMQDSLGAINDAHTFAELFDRLAQVTDEESLRHGLSLIRDRYQRRLAELASVFSDLWTEDQRRDYSDRFHAMLIAMDDVVAMDPFVFASIDGE